MWKVAVVVEMSSKKLRQNSWRAAVCMAILPANDDVVNENDILGNRRGVNICEKKIFVSENVVNFCLSVTVKVLC